MLVFRVYDQVGYYFFILSVLTPSYITPCNMASKKGSDAASYVASYLKAHDVSSEEEPEEFKPLECADFNPFMALYRKCKTELPALEKQKFLYKAQCNIRENPIMVDIIRKMFDFDLEVSELDNNLFSVKEKIELIFNFMDLFFQLYDGPMDPIVANLSKKMNNLRRYYDKKATLNMHHSETIVEIFRYCVRKDLILSVALKALFLKKLHRQQK